MDSRHTGGSRTEFTADFGRSVCFRIKRVVQRRATKQVDQDHGFRVTFPRSRQRKPGVFGVQQIRQRHTEQRQSTSRQRVPSSETVTHAF